MTYLALLLLAVVALLPLLLSFRHVSSGRSRREAALALHREQFAELDRDRAEGRISEAEHAAALLEVQRRMLAADALASSEEGSNRRLPMLTALVVVPVAAFGLYLVHGRPNLPGAPMSARISDTDGNAHSALMLVAMLRDRLGQPGLDPERAREGYVLLGNAEDSLGDLTQAAAAWRQAVRLRFDPALAALAAEAQTRVDGGRVSPDSAVLFAQALAEGPKDAAWRPIAEQRLKDSGGTAPETTK